MLLPHLALRCGAAVRSASKATPSRLLCAVNLDFLTGLGFATGPEFDA